MSEREATLAAGRDLKIRADLGAYHDRELSWWRRRRAEAGLRRSPELRRELELLQQISSAASTSEAAPSSPDLWGAISGQLAGIDRERRAQRGAASAPRPSGLLGLLGLSGALGTSGWSGLLGWRPIGLAVAAGAAVLAVGLRNAPGTVPDGQTGGVLRYLDTGGRSVMVVEAQDVTIIWLMEGSDGA